MSEEHFEESSLKTLHNEAKGLYIIDEIQRIKKPKSALEFYRDYVATNKPVIITDAISHWPALKKWTNSYLLSKIGDKLITVAVTPNGLADSVVDNKYFVMPEEKLMKFSEFLDKMENPSPNVVYYISKQNSNFQDEFGELFTDITNLDFATEAFGTVPDATNLWMGNHQSISSLHKDHYENIYAVVSGEKHFTLLPPTNLYYLYENNFTSAIFKSRLNDQNTFDIIESEDKTQVPWIPVDPDNADLNKYPLFKNASPLHVTVHAGEVLYLPSLYFHKVKQVEKSPQEPVIAVNFWYDMQFDLKYVYYKFMESVVQNERKLHSNQ